MPRCIFSESGRLQMARPARLLALALVAACAEGFALRPGRTLSHKIARSHDRRHVSVASSAAPADDATVTELPDRIVTITPNGMEQLMTLKKKQGMTDDDIMYVRMGIRAGGCSGFSYDMDVINEEDIDENDQIDDWGDNNLKVLVDPKSMLYLFGLQLDFSDALIGGGFQFENPNAESTCGCGKSFGVRAPRT